MTFIKSLVTCGENGIFCITYSFQLDIQFNWFRTVMAAMLKVGRVSRCMKVDQWFIVIFAEVINAAYLKGDITCQLIPSFK